MIAKLVEIFERAMEWRWEEVRRPIRGFFIARGAQTYLRWRWPWPLRKPYLHAQLRLYSLGGGVGDELMCTPIFREIKRLNPACQITFITRHPEMFRANPHLHAIELYSAKTVRRSIQLSYLPVLPPPRPLITLMAECVGLELRSSQLDPPIVEPSAEVRARVEAFVTPRIVIQPQASHWTPNKLWPRESWQALIEQLVERFEVIEVGTQPLFPGHDFGPRFHSLAGTGTLSDFIWTVSRAAVFVGPPSGGMHVANSFRVPSVIIFGGYESPAGYYYPWKEALYGTVACAPCWLTTPCPYDHKCLRMIPAERVFREVCKAVESGPVMDEALSLAT